MRQNTRLTVVIMAIAAVGWTLVSRQAPAQEMHHGGSFDAKQHGYEHGYRDGFEYGQEAHGRNIALNVHTAAYRDGLRGYSSIFGPRESFRQGYREGYAKGAKDGYSGEQARLEETYGERNFDADNVVKADLYDRSYSEHHW